MAPVNDQRQQGSGDGAGVVWLPDNRVFTGREKPMGLDIVIVDDQMSIRTMLRQVVEDISPGLRVA